MHLPGRWLALALALPVAACGDGIMGPGDDDGNLPSGDDPVGATDLELSIDSPGRGALIPAGQPVIVTGHVMNPGQQALLVNDMPVTIGEDGTFSVELQPTIGVNIIRADLGGPTGAHAQRGFLYGDFAPADTFVTNAMALRINREGLDDGDGEIDDLASITETSIGDRDVIQQLPGSYVFSAPVVGDVNVVILDRYAGWPIVDLTPRAGGLTARVTIPDVWIRHEISFGCLFTDCVSDGTAWADAVVVQVELDVSLQGDAIVAVPHDATIDLVNLQNVEDGSIAQLVQGAIEYFVPDLAQKIEDELQPVIANAVPDDLSVALSQLGLPHDVDLSPGGLNAHLVIDQHFDQVSFDGDGAVIAAGVRVAGAFEPGAPGASAIGWLRLGNGGGGYRTGPAFGISTAMDAVNQLLFAVWGQRGLDVVIPEGTIDVGLRAIGPVQVTLSAPPVVQAGEGTLKIAVADIMLDTTLDGIPTQIAVSITGDIRFTVDTGANLAHLELASQPVIYAELITGPPDVPGSFFTTLLEQTAPNLITQGIGSVPIPLPSLPLDAVSWSLSGQSLRLADPAEVVTNDPAARLTLYGRFLAQW